MVEVTKVNIEDYELDGIPLEFDEYTSDYDYGQFNQNYDYYLIKDLAYWDALVCFDRINKQAAAVQSQVIDCKEATKIIKEHLINLRR